MKLQKIINLKKNNILYLHLKLIADTFLIRPNEKSKSKYNVTVLSN